MVKPGHASLDRLVRSFRQNGKTLFFEAYAHEAREYFLYNRAIPQFLYRKPRVSWQ